MFPPHCLKASETGKSLTLTAADIPEEWRHHHQPFRLSKSAESLDKCTVFANPSPGWCGVPFFCR